MTEISTDHGPVGRAPSIPAFVGVDVAFAKEKVLPISIVSWQNGRLVPFRLRELGLTPPRGAGNVGALDEALVHEFAREAAAYLRTVARRLDLAIRCIAIDAPQAPARAAGVRRAAELALDAAGVSCFATPSDEEFERIRKKVRAHLTAGGAEGALPHANQLWMLVGFALFKELSEVAPCIEVFPQATVRAIGSGAVHKSRAGAVEDQLRAAAAFTGWPNPAQGESLSACVWGSAHDQLDAYLSAWVAALDEGERVALGTPPHDAIWVPRTNAIDRRFVVEPRPPEVVVQRAEARPRRLTSEPSIRPDNPVVCPACGEHTFQRWPWGWDAHAAHRCRGLMAEDPVARKAEYRTRFAHLFRG